MKTIETTAGAIPVKLRLTHVDPESGFARGLIFLPKSTEGQTEFANDRKHSFEVKFQEDSSELRFTDVRITGKKTLDLLVLEAVKKPLTALIRDRLP